MNADIKETIDDGESEKDSCLQSLHFGWDHDVYVKAIELDPDKEDVL